MTSVQADGNKLALESMDQARPRAARAARAPAAAPRARRARAPRRAP